MQLLQPLFFLGPHGPVALGLAEAFIADRLPVVHQPHNQGMIRLERIPIGQSHFRGAFHAEGPGAAVFQKHSGCDPREISLKEIAVQGQQLIQLHHLIHRSTEFPQTALLFLRTAQKQIFHQPVEHPMQNQRQHSQQDPDHHHLIFQEVGKILVVEPVYVVKAVDHQQNSTQQRNGINRGIAGKSPQLHHPALIKHVVQAYRIDAAGEGINGNGNHLGQDGRNRSGKHHAHTEKHGNKLSDGNIAIFTFFDDQGGSLQQGKYRQDDRDHRPAGNAVFKPPFHAVEDHPRVRDKHIAQVQNRDNGPGDKQHTPDKSALGVGIAVDKIVDGERYQENTGNGNHVPEFRSGEQLHPQKQGTNRPGGESQQQSDKGINQFVLFYAGYRQEQKDIAHDGQQGDDNEQPFIPGHRHFPPSGHPHSAFSESPAPFPGVRPLWESSGHCAAGTGLWFPASAW